jgi:aminopeptidase YwaD
VALKSGLRRAWVLLCAHFDTKIGTPGAWDNASGTAALLALVPLLAHEPLGCGLEFVAFNDEEYLGNDSQVYLARRGDTLGDMIAVINLDGIGHALATTTLMLAAGNDALQAAAEAITARYPGMLWVDPWPESSHSIFAFQGIPSFAISNRPHSPAYHLSGDTTDTLDGAKLAEAVRLAADLVRMLAVRDVERG